MKITPTPHRCAFAALVPTLMVLAAPAVAQEVQTTTAPAPTTTVTPPPVVPTAQSTPADAPAIVRGPSTPVVQQVPTSSQPASDDTAVRRATPVRTVKAAPQHAAPARPSMTRAAPAPAPKAETAPVAKVEPAPAAPKDTAPVAQTATMTAPAPKTDQASTVEKTVPAAATASTSDSGQTTTEGTPIWMWLVPLVVVLLAIGGLIVARRRRPEEVNVEPNYIEPVSVAAPEAVAPAYVEPAMEAHPIIADPEIDAAPLAVAPLVSRRPEFARDKLRTEAPIAAEPLRSADEDASVAVADDAEIVAADAADVDALTAGDPPVADRPWLEMAMRPVRAGTSAEDALVEIELTIGNAGTVAADDVRISTFMFAGEPDTAEMERLLINRDASAVPPITIKPGEGTTVEATLALSREMLDGEVSPVIVADARYPLPDGGEGRTSASFRIGVSQEDGSITPIQIGRPHMTQTVDAELYGTPQRV